MNKKQIESVRQQLHSLILQNAGYDKIYNKSIELDILINQFYSDLAITA